MTVPRDQGAPAPASGDVRSDRELLAAHLTGDQTAFDELVGRHRRRLWNLALRTLRDREDAADALQDGFVRAFRAAEGYRGDAEVSSWLHRIVLNVCLDRISSRRRRATLSLDDQVDDEYGTDLVDPTDAYAAADAHRAAGELLARLPDEQRLAIVLVDVEGYSVTEAADALGVAAGTVKSRCARGRARLAAVLARSRDSDTPRRVTAREGRARRPDEEKAGGEQR